MCRFDVSPGQKNKDLVVCHSSYALRDVLKAIIRYGSLAATGADQLALCC